MIDLAKQAGEIPPEHRDKILETVFERERSMSTGMEKGIAIPHASLALIDHVVGAIGIARTGIPFESLDGQPASLIILLVIPKDKFQQHVRTLAGIARLFNHDEMTRALRQAKNPDEAMEIITEEEGRDLFYT